MFLATTKKKGQFSADKKGHKLIELIFDMQWDYDRMSSSGQQTLDKIYKILNTPEETVQIDEVTK